MGLDIFFNSKASNSELGYLRKCNIVYAYFGDKIGDDEKAIVTREEIEELKDACEEILEKNKEVGFTEEFEELAIEKLRTQEGFFFGSTEYDESYISQVESTLEEANKVLDMTEAGEEIEIVFWW